MSETDLLFPLQFPGQLEVGILFFEARHLSKGALLGPWTPPPAAVLTL